MADQEKINKMAEDICLVKHNCNDVCNPINTCNALKYARRAYEAGYRQQEWISVEERLPDKQGHFLIVDEKQNMFIALWTKQFGWFMHVRNRDKITHWMPLPEPPKGV